MFAIVYLVIPFCDEYTIEQFIRREMETDGFTKGGGTTDLEAVKLWKSYRII